MNARFVPSVLRGRNFSLLALVAAAMVATTTSAHANLITVASTGQVGPASSPPANEPGVITNGATPTATNWVNTNCSGTACGGNGTSIGYNFAYSGVGNTSTAGSALGGASGSSGTVAMDSATVADTHCSGCGVMALEADNYSRAAMDLTLSGLTAGETVTVSFDFAGDQQSTSSCGGNCSGDFDSLLTVSLGSQSDATLDAAVGATIPGDIATGSSCTSAPTSSPCIVSQGFSGWEQESLTFTVGNGTGADVLSFLASAPGNQTQVPAFALVDDLTVTTPSSPTPEPNSLLLLSTGLLGLGGFVRSRFAKSVAANV